MNKFSTPTRKYQVVLHFAAILWEINHFMTPHVTFHMEGIVRAIKGI